MFSHSFRLERCTGVGCQRKKCRSHCTKPAVLFLWGYPYTLYRIYRIWNKTQGHTHLPQKGFINAIHLEILRTCILKKYQKKKNKYSKVNSAWRWRTGGMWLQSTIWMFCSNHQKLWRKHLESNSTPYLKMLFSLKIIQSVSLQFYEFWNITKDRTYSLDFNCTLENKNFFWCLVL